MLIRPETAADFTAITSLVDDAFGGTFESRLISNVRAGNTYLPRLTLVAVSGTRVVGHIMFSRIEIVSEDSAVDAIALAPLAVVPEMQRRGIGSALVRHGLAACGSDGHGIVVVLGHADYYPRFGFQTARPLGIVPPFQVGDPYFMVAETIPGGLRGVSGEVRYPAAFDEP